MSTTPIDFYTFPPKFGLRNASPFCLKLEAYLELANIPYTRHDIMDPRQAPKSKIPYIAENGVKTGDTELIIAQLKQSHGDPLADGLSAEQRAFTHTVNVMLAERFAWAALTYPRWVKSDHHALMVKTWFGAIPRIMRGFITKSIFKDMKKRADAHGIGKHTEEEIYALALSDIKSLEAILGDKQFMLGDTPREIDASAYSFLHGTASEIFVTPLSQYVRSNKTLMDYIDRVDIAAFGEVWQG